MLKTRSAQTVKQKPYSMIIFFNNHAITAKFYNAENITNYLVLLKIIPNAPHVSEFYGSRRLLARIKLWLWF